MGAFTDASLSTGLPTLPPVSVPRRHERLFRICLDVVDERDDEDVDHISMTQREYDQCRPWDDHQTNYKRTFVRLGGSGIRVAWLFGGLIAMAKTVI